MQNRIRITNIYATPWHPTDAATTGGLSDYLKLWRFAPYHRLSADQLPRVADNLTQSIPSARFTGQQPVGELARCLSAAAKLLTAGRDLLHTHLTTTPDDLQEGRSQWAPVVTSLPVTRALTDTIARWSAHLAVITARMPPASTAGVAELGEGVEAAAQWLWLAEAAARAARTIDPASGDDRRLLRAIPTARRPRRQPPGPGESVRELTLGITASAQRLRARAFAAVAGARWLTPSADTWHWAANAAAVSGHASELILRLLASHPTSGASQPLDGTLIPAAAGAGFSGEFRLHFRASFGPTS